MTRGRRRPRVLLVGLLLAFLLTSVGSPLGGSALASASRSHLVSHATSSNWAGYVVKAPKGAISDVKGSWIVPKVTCPAQGRLYSSFWVGIDGDGSPTVEQTGTDSDCAHGSASYFAWYEFFPAYPHTLSLKITVGDSISADVSYGSGTFTTTLSDRTTGKSASATSTIHAQRASAEWIAEAPSSSSVLPLADFGSVHFGYDATHVTSTCSATISGTAHKLGSISHVFPLTMVSRTGATKAKPSAVSSDGTSFVVTWVRSGP
jgi:hypothetical protein